MRLPFRRKKDAQQGRPQVQPQVQQQVEPREAGPSQGVGMAGYSRTGLKKHNMPQMRFTYVRPDGQPAPPKGSERRPRGFFS